ncbi:MAG TPA: HD-GYP domain-containing protein [bacterium]|nr:HD-GYP domain-containing protein [bacterium]
MSIIGCLALGSSILIIAAHNMQVTHLVLLAVGVLGGWLRFRTAPVGTLTLSPIAFFLALLIAGPLQAFAIFMIAKALSCLLFERRHTLRALLEVGEESIPTAVAVLMAVRSGLGPMVASTAVPYAIATAAYVVLRLAVNSVSAYVTEGITFRVFLSETIMKTAANLILLSLLAFGLRTYLYDRFGNLALVLVTVALVEFYHPWKLLNEQDEILFANLALVAQAIDVKDPYTARHSKNVSELAVRIARAMNLPEAEVRKIRIGALMHDIGKIGVGTHIIRKPSRLDASEERTMRMHPMLSADIMQPIELLTEAAEIVRHHHEHLDGSGYPAGLRGDEIPIGSRVILVADAFDAMTTDRPYRRGRSKEEALKVLKENAGKQFDFAVVEALESILPRM